MHRKRTQIRARVAAAIAAIAALMFSIVAAADPPSRVARLSYIDGTASFLPAGEDEWVRAVVNRPLVAGDRVWFDANARGEIEMSNATLRFGASTNVGILNIDDRIEQLELTQGALHLHVRTLRQGESIEIDTPNAAFSISRPGSYRFDVDADDGWTTIAVRSGEGEAFGEGNAYRIAAGQVFRFRGTDLRDYEYLASAPPDALERWAQSRERRYERVAAARYVSPEVIGYEDLDSYGTWQTVADYGPVWIPREVPSGWAPYRYGHWAWIDPWGWTWIDDAPWGFAPFHYGRWAFVGERWCWVPGPVRERAVYAPALVAFVGGNGFSVSVSSGAIGWFPLAPREVYRPWYSTSREYFTRVNVTNTVINVNHVTNVYNSRDTAQLRYAYQQRPTAFTAVPQTAFVQSQPVHRAAISVQQQAIARAQVLERPDVAPQRVSIVGNAPRANARPPAVAMEKPVIAKAPPAVAPPRAVEGAPQRQEPAGRRNVRVVQAQTPQPAPTTSAPMPPGQPRRAAEPPPQAQAPAPPSEATPSPRAGPSTTPPGQQRRAAEPPRQAQAPAAAPDATPRAGPPTLPPGQQRRVEPPTPSPAPPPQTAQPNRPAPQPPAAPIEPRRGPPERTAPPQMATPQPQPRGGPPPSVQAEPRRGPPERAAPPPQIATPQPHGGPPVAQSEPRRGPPPERAAPPPQPVSPPQAAPRASPPQMAMPPQPQGGPPPQAAARAAPPQIATPQPQGAPPHAGPPGRPEGQGGPPGADRGGPPQRGEGHGKGRDDNRS